MKSVGPIAQSARSSSASRSSGPVTATGAAWRDALRSSRQAYSVRLGTLKWKRISVTGRDAGRRRRYLSGVAEDEMGQQADRPAGRAFGRARFPGGAGDVEMRPGILGSEAAEEHRGGDSAAGPAADVAHVGEVALQCLAVLFVERHPPARVEGRPAGRQHLVGHAVVAAEQARVVIAE